MQNKKPGPERLPDRGGWWIHGLLAAAALVFFRDVLTRTSFFWNDFLYQYYAFRSFAATSLAGGDLPLWNPYTFNGMPFQADIQSAIFYVPNLLLTLFVRGGALDYWWVEVSIILHFALAGSGMYLLARHLGIDRWYAAFSGLVYTFSGFMVGHLIHQGFIYQAAWFPLVFLTFRRAILERSYLHGILCGLLFGHALLAGAPQITLYIAFFLFIYFLFELVRGVRNGGVKSAAGIVPRAAVPIVLAGLVTAVQLLPTAELAPLSQRAEITYDQAAEGSFEPVQFIMFAVPRYFGANTGQASNYRGPGDYWQYWEANAYIGIAGLAFAIAALFFRRKDPFALFLGGMILFAILYALGSHFFLHRLFHEFVPRFDSFRVPARMVLYACFAGSILAGFGMQHVVGEAAKRPNACTRIAAVIAAAGIVVFLIGQTGLLVPEMAASERTLALGDAATSSVLAAVIALALALAVHLAGRGKLSPGVFIPFVFALQFADVHAFGFDQNNGPVNPDDYYSETKQLVEYFKEEGKKELFRINSREGGYMLLDRNQGMLDRIFLMEGYTPLGLARFVPPLSSWDRTCDLMNAKYRVIVKEAENAMSVGEVKGYAPRGFMVYSAKVVASAEEARRFMSDSSFEAGAQAVFETPPPVLYQSTERPGAVVDFESYRLNEIRMSVDNPRDGYLMLSEVWYPGWRATVDGVDAPVLQADWCLRAVPLTAGKHVIVMEFSPSSFRTGAWISSVTLALSIAGIFYFRKKEDRA